MPLLQINKKNGMRRCKRCYKIVTIYQSLRYEQAWSEDDAGHVYCRACTDALEKSA